MRYESTGFFAAVRYCLQDFRRLSHFVGELVRPDELCVVGDRLLTDVLFGNLHGLLTVHLTTTLSLTGDNAMARLFRGLESAVLLPLLKAVGCEAPRHAGWDKAAPPDR